MNPYYPLNYLFYGFLSLTIPREKEKKKQARDFEVKYYIYKERGK